MTHEEFMVVLAIKEHLQKKNYLQTEEKKLLHRMQDRLEQGMREIAKYTCQKR